MLGIEKTQDLSIYLGAPLLHQRISNHTFTFMIDKMKNKMSGWEAYSLSFAGRVTLAQASLANITGYVMQTCAIPISVCEEAAKLCRNFIRGSTTDQRKCHLIYLSKMCLPKEEGGLGFRDLKVLNKAYMMKLA